ncbi:hypothetical protein Tco_1422783 [Tanacetum coccineum]
MIWLFRILRLEDGSGFEIKDKWDKVREHAAAVLAGLMKGEDGELSKDFRERAYSEATKLQKRRKQRNATGGPSIASIHDRVLALAAYLERSERFIYRRTT